MKNILHHLLITPIYVVLIFSCNPQKKEGVVQESTEQKIDSLINQMTLEEKVHMVHASSSFTSGGVERLGIPELVMSDGPHGVRMEHGRDWVQDNDGTDSATYLPVGVALASTWNPDLGYQFGSVLGSEANFRGKDVILGPGICIIRTPLNGRNFEYMSEDPYLISQMAPEYIKGVQDQGVAACVKHYIANNQETQRGSIDVEMSERAFREIYLPGFAAAVKDGGVYTLMGAYNKFRGQFCTHNEYLINKVLKDQLGFKGAVISDWGAVHDTFQAAVYGTDLEMGTDLSMLPNPDYNKFFMADSLLAMVRSGRVDETLIDDKVKRILRVMFWTKKIGERQKGTFNTPGHQEITKKIAEEAIVLLKNDNHTLPLNASNLKKIAVIGENAIRRQAAGGGSSQVRAKYEVTPLEGIKKMTGNQISVSYSQGYKISKNPVDNTQMISEAVAMAKEADVAIIVGGLVHGYTDAWNDNAYDAESVDRPDMQLPFHQNELIKAVVAANPKTIVVLISGGAVDMTQWVDQVPAILEAWYPGMEGGDALAEIVLGKVNPSGKLPMTFPKKLSDSPDQVLGEYPGKDGVVNYYDDIFVGYRYYDTKKVEPLFCFGHGLSYTQFAYSNINISKSADGSPNVSVSLDVRNVGSIDGKETVQLYVHDVEASVERPAKELKAFSKVNLKAGETTTVTFNLDEKAFSFYDEDNMKWTLEPGTFEIIIGSSSRDIRLTGTVDL